METFWIKPKLYFGPEPLEALSALAGKRVLIVTDAFLASSGLLDRVKARLTGEVSVFDRVEPDPSLPVCKRFHVNDPHASEKDRFFAEAVALHEYQLKKAHEQGLKRADVSPFLGLKRTERSNEMPA